jgi:hypothetical protein
MQMYNRILFSPAPTDADTFVTLAANSEWFGHSRERRHSSKAISLSKLPSCSPSRHLQPVPINPAIEHAVESGEQRSARHHAVGALTACKRVTRHDRIAVAIHCRNIADLVPSHDCVFQHDFLRSGARRTCRFARRTVRPTRTIDRLGSTRLVLHTYTTCSIRRLMQRLHFKRLDQDVVSGSESFSERKRSEESVGALAVAAERLFEGVNFPDTARAISLHVVTVLSSQTSSNREARGRLL